MTYRSGGSSAKHHSAGGKLTRSGGGFTSSQPYSMRGSAKRTWLIVALVVLVVVVGVVMWRWYGTKTATGPYTQTGQGAAGSYGGRNVGEGGGGRFIVPEPAGADIGSGGQAAAPAGAM